MKILIINQAEVHQLLPIGECMETMAEALAALSDGKALNPLRQVLHLPEKQGLLGIMPGYLESLNAMGLKVVSVFHNNKGSEHDSHQGAVLVFEAEHGTLLAMVDASAITAIRTAAVSGVATRLLAREDAVELAILGSGVQAHAHVNAMMAARHINRVRVWSPNPDHVKAFARNISDKQDVSVAQTSNAQDAVKGADIVCTTTSAREPILHIQGEIGEILSGQIIGRQSEDEITLFKSLGLAVEDIASAYLVYQKAVGRGFGTWVEFGGNRQVSL